MEAKKVMSEQQRLEEIQATNLTGMRLRELREEKGYSLDQLAVKLDNKYSSSVLGKHERGERNPKRKCLEDMAKLYGVDVNYLLGLTHVRKRGLAEGNQKDQSVSEDEKKLVEDFKKCDKKTKELIFYTLRTFVEDRD